MGLLINIVALVLVVALSWGAMMIMAAWVHRRRGGELGELWLGSVVEECAECAGVGARRRYGELEPCPTCEGRGVVTMPTSSPPDRASD